GLRLAALADVDAALEERSVFNGNAGSDHVTGEGAVTADVDTVAGREIAADLAKNHDFARVDVGGNDAIASNSDAVARQIDGTLDAAVDIKGLGAGHLALDYKRLADGSLVRGRGGHRPGSGCRFTGRHDGSAWTRRSWALR